MRTLNPGVFSFPMEAAYKIKFESGKENEGFFAADVRAKVLSSGVLIFPEIEIKNINIMCIDDISKKELHELKDFVQKEIKEKVCENWVYAQQLFPFFDYKPC